jgi:hypothetical protein
MLSLGEHKIMQKFYQLKDTKLSDGKFERIPDDGKL